jgi:hypothetical protein
MYTDMREEARDHARVRNAYFEQVRSWAEEKMDGWGAGSIYYYEGLGPD